MNIPGNLPREDRNAVAALERLVRIALSDTGQARRVADFLLAWHNADENDGWDPMDLWNVDLVNANDMLLVARLILSSREYPGNLGFNKEFRGSGTGGGCHHYPLAPFLAEPDKEQRFFRIAALPFSEKE